MNNYFFNVKMGVSSESLFQKTHTNFLLIERGQTYCIFGLQIFNQFVGLFVLEELVEYESKLQNQNVYF